MKVALVSSIALTDSSQARAGGIGVYVKELTNELSKRQIHTTIITNPAQITSPHSSSDKTTIFDESLVTINTISKKPTRSNMRFILKLMFKLPFQKFDKDTVIHAQRTEMLLPFIWFKRKLPRVTTLHGSSYKGVTIKRSSMYAALFSRMEGYCLKRSSKIIAVDNTTRKEYMQRFPNIADKITVIPTGIDLNHFKVMAKSPLRAKYKIPLGSKVILYIGRLEREKRIDVLLEAFAKLAPNQTGSKSEINLLIAGSGKFGSELADKAKSMKLKNVTFMGAVPHGTVPELMNLSDVFVLCSAFEGSPTVVREALACGLPVVASRVGNIPDMVESGKTGELVGSDANPSELAKKINKVLKDINNNNITKDACVSKAKPFGWEALADKIVGIYDDAR